MIKRTTMLFAVLVVGLLSSSVFAVDADPPISQDNIQLEAVADRDFPAPLLISDSPLVSATVPMYAKPAFQSVLAVVVANDLSMGEVSERTDQLIVRRL